MLIDSSRKLDVGRAFARTIRSRDYSGARRQKLTWLDTTQEVTPYGLLLYQLRNKLAIVASDDAEGGVRRTPADSPMKTFVAFSH